MPGAIESTVDVFIDIRSIVIIPLDFLAAEIVTSKTQQLSVSLLDRNTIDTNVYTVYSSCRVVELPDSFDQRYYKPRQVTLAPSIEY